MNLQMRGGEGREWRVLGPCFNYHKLACHGTCRDKNLGHEIIPNKHVFLSL